MIRRVRWIICVVFGLSGLVSWPAAAETALIAVAANFAVPLDALRPDFERAYGHELKIAIGSTGKLYAQIVKGAPFDVMLAADQARPRKLEREGHVVSGSRFTYATGRLALWSRNANLAGDDVAAVLREAKFRRLAMANPELAPYGLAARQTLEALRMGGRFKDKIVMAENIGQTFAMVSTGNAEAGFVALSSLLTPGVRITGRHWPVPPRLHQPIRQDAVLLRHGDGNPAAIDFLAFLKTPKAGAVIARFGYGTD